MSECCSWSLLGVACADPLAISELLGQFGFHLVPFLLPPLYLMVSTSFVKTFHIAVNSPVASAKVTVAVIHADATASPGVAGPLLVAAP